MENGLLGDFCDGSLFKAHNLYSIDPCGLQIQLYYDEAEICNPIGSHRGVHKLGKCIITTCTCVCQVCGL